MRNKIFVFIFVIIIPFFIYFIDRVIFDNRVIEASYDQSQEWKMIYENQDDYPLALIELALRNKETIPFVSRYPYNRHKTSKMTLERELSFEMVPLLLQWDERWGYEKYGQDMMAMNGCGPTCLSMVASYLKQDPTLHPYAIAQYAYKHGYYNKGTSPSLMSEGARHLGLRVQKLPLTQHAIMNALKNNQLIICQVRKDTLTCKRHFIVLRGYQDGLIYVNDPNSIVKSQRGYTYNELSHQIKNLWSYDI